MFIATRRTIFRASERSRDFSICQIQQPHYATASSFSETQISSPFEPRQGDPFAFFKPAFSPHFQTGSNTKASVLMRNAKI
jgi:hypothetical protein